MYHVIQFTRSVRMDLETSRSKRLERTLVKTGSRLCVQLKPHVAETPWGPVEVADLFLDGGTVARAVPYGCFAFVDRDD